jgi:hypothetical protein
VQLDMQLLCCLCVRLQAGQEAAAAFLEITRVAAIKGATTEFEKLEGFTFGECRCCF